MGRAGIAAWLAAVLGGLLPGAPAAPEGFRLPDGVRPRAYQVELRIDPASERFSGAVRVEVEVTRASALIWLNAKGLEIESAAVEFGGRSVAALATVVDDEFLALETEAPVAAGTATLALRFSGRVDEKRLTGPYRRALAREWYVFTTFTAIEARRAFPCFDEPRFKTPWQLTLRIPKGQRAFSNARAVRESGTADGWTEVEFGRTAQLPSEVVAFAVGPFDRTAEARAGRRGIAVSTVTPRGLAGQGGYATTVTDSVMRRLERYTGMDYPWDKLDHVALAEGAFGAVENPGLITYASRILLMPREKVTEERQRAIRSIMTHELAHQWFGNLVTQADWSDVWLSEGFATWLTGRLMDEERPAGARNVNAVAARERIMAADAGEKSRPVRLAMADRKAMEGVYSSFVYQKAGAVLLMLEGWTGEERFQAALRGYLKRHKHGNATTADLSAVLRPGGAAVLDSFLNRKGIPEVRVEARCEEGKAPKLVLEQGQREQPWVIPVCWRTDGAGECTLLEGGRTEVALRSCPAWVLPNAGGTGYYRSVWKGKLPPAGSLTAAERLTLVYDLQSRGKGYEAGAAVLKELGRDGDRQVSEAARKALGKGPAATKQ